MRRSNPPRLLHITAQACVQPAAHNSAQLEVQILCANLCDWDTDIDSSMGRKPVTTDLVRRCELLICEMTVEPVRRRATSVHRRRATESPHVVRLGESRCNSIEDHGHTRNRLESVEGYAQQQRMNRVAPEGPTRCLEQKRVSAREGIGRIRTS